MSIVHKKISYLQCGHPTTMKTIIGSVTTDDDGNKGVAIDRHRPCGGKRTSRNLLISEGSRRRYGHRPTAGAAAAVNDNDDGLDDH